MNFDDTPREAEFRALVRSWIAANAPKELEDELNRAALSRVRLKSVDIVKAAKDWQKKKAEAGWACLLWPKEFGGRGASPIERVIWDQEEGVYRKLNSPFVVGHGMCGPTLLAYGSDAVKRRYLPPLASGEEVWCQLFSEPAAGSDLAGLRTKAERSGDDWIINGQKIWTTAAHFSDYGLLIARTDPEVAKHQGLTMFYVDMKAPGIEVRPIRQANGEADFNEVYLTNVRLPDTQRLGNVGDGWNVSITTLMNERYAVGLNIATGFEQLFEYCLDLKTDNGPAMDDPVVRSRLAEFATRANGLKYTSYRTISAISRGERPGPESSIGKLVAASMLQDIAIYALDLQGAVGALVEDDQGEVAGQFQKMLLSSPGSRIAGGTDEVMRNIIAERILGLPSDIRVDKNVPFNKIPINGRV